MAHQSGAKLLLVLFSLLIGSTWAADEVASPESIQKLIYQEPGRAIDALQQRLDGTEGTRRARIYQLLAEAHVALEQGTEALKYAEQGLALVTAESQPELYVNLLLEQGSGSLLNGSLETALSLYQRALELAKNRKLTHLIARSLYHISYVHYLNWDTNKALQFVQEAYGLYQESQQDPRGEGISLIILGNIYADFNDLAQSEDYLKRALPLFHEAEDYVNYQLALYSLARNASDMENYPLAEKRFSELGRLAKRNDDSLNQTYAEMGLCRVALKTEEHERALEHCDSAIELARQNNYEHLLSEPLRYLSQILLKLNRLTDAEDALQQAEKLVDETDDSNQMTALLMVKAELKAQQNQYQQAYQLLQQWIERNNEYQKSLLENQTQELRVRFEVEREQAANELLEKEKQLTQQRLIERERRNALQKRWLIASLILLAILILFAIQLIRTQIKFKRLATIDSLTKIANRRHLLYVGSQLLHSHDARRQPLSVIIFDIDYFKRINDTYGHKIGDGVIQMISELVRGVIRSHDLFGRIGGEEFVLVLPSCSLEPARLLAERIRIAIFNGNFTNLHPELHVTVSLGVAQASGEKDIAQLIDKADKALYSAKNSGRNRVCTAPLSPSPVESQ